MIADLPEWTDADSDALDAWILARRAAIVEHMREVLTPVGKQRDNQVPTHCRYCRKPLRPNNTLASDYPGTVVHVGMECCRSCRRRRGPSLAFAPYIPKLAPRPLPPGDEADDADTERISA